jgi:PAS domain S-box-containing protein
VAFGASNYLRKGLEMNDACSGEEPIGDSIDQLKLYRLLVENTLGLMRIHDLMGVLYFINPAAAQALGYNPEDGIGRNLRDFSAPSVRHLFDEYLNRIRNESISNGPMRIVTRDGSEGDWQTSWRRCGARRSTWD